MKTKKISKKLTLHKSTVARLNSNDLKRFFGGAEQTINPVCPTVSCVSCNPTNCDPTDYTCVSVRICPID